MSEQREAMENVIHALPNAWIGKEYITPVSGIVEAISDHIWDRAMQPEVIEAVANRMYPHSLILRNGMDGSIEGLLDKKDAAQLLAEWLLTAVIGPRPEAASGEGES